MKTSKDKPKKKAPIPPPPALPVKIGRPTDYEPRYCDMLIDHMAQGLSYTSFAALVDCAVSTLYEWEKNFPAFSEAKKIGEPKTELFWERMGIAGTCGDLGRNFNAGSWIFNMKNRHGWTDKTDVTPPQAIPISISYNPKEASASDVHK